MAKGLNGRARKDFRMALGEMKRIELKLAQGSSFEAMVSDLTEAIFTPEPAAQTA